MANRILFLLFAFILVALGTSLTIEASMIGLAPFTALYKWLADSIFSVGMWVILIQAVFIIFSYLIEKRPPKIGTFINMIFTGLMIDVFTWLDLVPSLDSWGLLLVIFILGIAIQSFGVALAVCIDLGPGAITQFSVALENAHNIKVKYSIIFLNIAVVVIVLLGSGPVSFGTILAGCLSGPFTDTGLKFWKKIYL